MLSVPLTAGVLAASLFSPLPLSPALSALPAPGPQAEQADVLMIPLVREDIGAWYRLTVGQECPESHPYVHTDGWFGSLPENVYTDFAYGSTSGEPATRIDGSMMNWNFEPRSVPLDLKCTSDAGQAIQIPSRWDPEP